MAEFDIAPRPHEEAAREIAGKRAVSRDVFYGLLPELRGRAFAVSGIEAATVLQRTRDAIAGLARGVDAEGKAQTWDTVKEQVVAELEPYLGAGAERRATVLIRTHGFEAFQAANWRVAQEDEDTTHLQYLATEDDRVRDTHRALNGIVLPKNDPFWQKHYPPWEWGCRCRVRPMNPDLVDEERARDETRNPEDRNVLEGALAAKLRNGSIVRGTRTYNVTPPSERPGSEDGFQWHPDDLRLSVGDLKQRYDPEVWNGFEDWAKGQMAGKDLTVWNWLLSRPVKRTRAEIARTDVETRRRMNELANDDAERNVKSYEGSAGISRRADGGVYDFARRTGEAGERLFRTFRSSYTREPCDAETARAIGAHIAAVAGGRKPLYHDEYGQDAEFLAKRLKSLLPPSVEVHARDGHLYVYRVDSIRMVIQSKPSEYPGSTLLDQVHSATLSGTNGELLGYGAKSMFGPDTVSVLVLNPSGRVVLSFSSNKQQALEYALARALDFSQYTGQAYSFEIKDR